MLVATLGACGSGTTKTTGDSTAAQSQDSGSKQEANTERVRWIILSHRLKV